MISLCPLLTGFFGDGDEEHEPVAMNTQESQSDGVDVEEESGNDGDLQGSSYTDDYAEDESFDREDYTTHFLSAHGALGQGWSLGIGYSLASGSESQHGAGWAAIGPSVNVSRRGESDYGVFSLVTSRIGAFSHGGIACEFSAGWGASGNIRAGIIGAGLYFSVEYVEFGYSVRAPVGVSRRPPWLGKHFFSVRIHSPLKSTSTRPTPFD